MNAHRVQLVAGMRRRLIRVFPTHWSFMLAEVAFYSFVVLLVTGIYLALFFDPSMADVGYDGPLDNLIGVPMSRAYESALEISFEVRAGLLIRQVHNWAATLFLAALLASLLATFFTGAFRRPRRTVWMVGVLLLAVGVFEAFTGALVLGDLLSGTSLRMVSGYLLSTPVVGTWLHWMLFGAEFPGTEIIPRLYLVHWLLPGIMLALIAVMAGLLGRHGHPRSAGRGRAERNVTEVRTLRGVVARATALFTVTVGVLVLLGGLFQVNAIWNYGPADAADVSAGSTPPWYFGWVDGAVRLWPAWDIEVGGYTVPAAMWPSIVFLPLSFVAFAVYPWLERRIVGDDAPQHVLQRPRDVPVRTALGVMVATFYCCLQLAAAIDVVASEFDLSADALLWAGRIGALALPPLAYVLTYRFCLGLQHDDRAVLEHGIETGIIKRLPHGGYIEVHQPLAGVDSHGNPIRLEYREAPVPKRMNQLGAAGRPVVGSFLRPDSAGRGGSARARPSTRRALADPTASLSSPAVP